MSPRPYLAQLQKDARRLAGPFALCLTSGIIFTGLDSREHVVPAGHGFSVALVGTVVSAIVFELTTLVLAACVVLEDPPKGTTAFWLTRPLPRSRVLAAKATLLVAIALLPILIELIFVVAGNLDAAGPTAGGLLAWSLTRFMVRLPLVLAAAAFAITAETFGEFLITTLLLLISCGIAAWVLGTWLPGLNPFDGSSSLEASRLWAVQILGTLLAGSIVAWQYSRRHSRLAVGAVAAAALAMMLVPFHWRWDFVRGLASDRTALPPALASVPPPHGLRFQLRLAPHPTPADQRITGVIDPIAGPAGTVILPTRLSKLEIAWQPNGRVSVAGQEVQLEMTLRSCPPALAAALAPLRVIDPLAPRHWLDNLPIEGEASLVSFPFYQVSGASMDWNLHPAGKLRAEVEAGWFRYVPAGELPVQRGAVATWDRGRWRVTERSESPGEVRFDITAGTISSFLDEFSSDPDAEATVIVTASGPTADTTTTAGNHTVKYSSQDDGGRQPLLILVNAARGEAILSKRSTKISQTTRSEYQRATYRVLFADPAIDADWLKDAKLVRYELIRIAPVAGSLEADLPAAVRP